MIINNSTLFKSTNNSKKNRNKVFAYAIALPVISINYRMRLQLFLFATIINGSILNAQMSDTTRAPMVFLNVCTFFSPATNDMYFNPALDIDVGFMKTNKKNYFAWGASTEVWYFTSVKYDGQNKPTIMNNADGFININGIFFYDNKYITPYLAPTLSFASDFKNVGASGGIALGLTHNTGKRLETFIIAKYIKFSEKLNYLNMYFFMIGLSLKLSN